MICYPFIKCRWMRHISKLLEEKKMARFLQDLSSTPHKNFLRNFIGRRFFPPFFLMRRNAEVDWIGGEKERGVKFWGVFWREIPHLFCFLPSYHWSLRVNIVTDYTRLCDASPKLGMKIGVDVYFHDFRWLVGCGATSF